LQELGSIAGQQAAPLIATSRAVANLPGLEALLGAPVLHRRSVRDVSSCGGVIAWGSKASATKAADFAVRHGLPLLRLEDGFIRSLGFTKQDPPLSVVVDDSGIYYDANSPSLLETLIVGRYSESQQARAGALVAAWRLARLSKYNRAREEIAGGLPARYVLVADQVRGDASIINGYADESSFSRMLSAALVEHPDCVVLVKLHTKVLHGHKRGYFNEKLLKSNSRIHLQENDVHPATLIEGAKAVYVVTSQLGFEGLLWGKPVRTFGMPFYAGWGLTLDELAAPQRRMPVSLENLVHAALIGYPRYIDPETGKRCEVERVVEWMALQLRMRNRFPEIVYASGFSIYKRPVICNFFQGCQVRFVRRTSQIPDGATLAVWGRKECYPPVNGSVIRLEDGFIRSVGLGADLVRPLSWVMDQSGIYFDATRPSDLELILNKMIFDCTLLVRAQKLRARLVADGLTKYNVGVAGWKRPDCCALSDKAEEMSRRVILVPGQVETDASLAYGAPGICRNIDLLRAVRAANPEAYVIYKPHPDVVAGLRREGSGEVEAAHWCDEVLVDVSMGALLLLIDEVHTLTSLTGFEALLRGKKVVCYGQPFYAGWGLTCDILPVERRTCRRSVDELVAGVLISYPAYISRTTGKFTTPERALDELLIWRENVIATLPWWGRMYRFLMRKVLRHA